MATVMKWNGFNLLYPQNFTTNTIGYGDLKPDYISPEGYQVQDDASTPNRFLQSLGSAGRRSAIQWSDLMTRGSGNQKSTGAFQVRFWFFAGTTFKTIPTGFHFTVARTYDNNNEWVHCLQYYGNDLYLRVGAAFGNLSVLVWKNAINDAGWKNKWHRIELSCNNTKEVSAARIDSRSWVDAKWKRTWGSSTGKPIVNLNRLAVGAYEYSSPTNVAFRNIEIVDNHDSASFTYDWVPPAGPTFNLPANKTIQAQNETANIGVLNSGLGDAPIESAVWKSTKSDGTSPVGVIKTENVFTSFANYKVTRGPYTTDGTDTVSLTVTDRNKLTVTKSMQVYVGLAADTGPVISTNDRTILEGQSATVFVQTTMAGNNGATYPDKKPTMPVLDPYSAPDGGSAGGTTTFYEYPYEVIPSESNPARVPYNLIYTRTGTSPWNVLTLEFQQFNVPGNYSFDVTVENSKGIQSALTFTITVNAIDPLVWEVISPTLPDEFGNIPEYYKGQSFPVEVKVYPGNRGTLSLRDPDLLGTALSAETFVKVNDYYHYEGIGYVTTVKDGEPNSISLTVQDGIGNVIGMPAVYYNARVPYPLTATLSPDNIIIDANTTSSILFEALINPGATPTVLSSARWNIIDAPADYNGAIEYTSTTMTFSGYDKQGIYTILYEVEDEAGNTASAYSNIFISFGDPIGTQAPRDILDWMTNSQLALLAIQTLSGIYEGTTTHILQQYYQQVLPTGLPNKYSMSYHQLQREFFKAIVNGDLSVDLALFGILDGGDPFTGGTNG